ncbi:unnamed protein product [Ilex paraguariensis]|uniref:PGG domain-containing protein n=1 Tax=Ilex paraguariensis TaxID=185542 RepID=A0ABC8V455_9AQUA
MSGQSPPEISSSGAEAEALKAYQQLAKHLGPYLQKSKDLGFSSINDSMNTVVETDENAFLGMHKHGGGTSLHAAAGKGEVDIMKKTLDASPESVKSVTKTGENCLHSAVLNNQVVAVRFLVDWLARNRDYAHLINDRDYKGNTPFHLAVSRKQIQTLEALLTCNVVDVNATNCGGFTALDILSVLPYTGKIDVKIDKILCQAGALRARDLANRDTNSCADHGYKIKWFKMLLLLMATLVMTITYRSASITAGITFNEGGGNLNVQKWIITQFMFFNTMGFVGSLAVAIFIIQKLSTLLDVMLLLMATLVMTTACQPAFIASGITFNEGGGNLKVQEWIITQFMFFNTMGFVGSLAMAIFFIQKLSTLLDVVRDVHG